MYLSIFVQHTFAHRFQSEPKHSSAYYEKLAQCFLHMRYKMSMKNDPCFFSLTLFSMRYGAFTLFPLQQISRLYMQFLINKPESKQIYTICHSTENVHRKIYWPSVRPEISWLGKQHNSQRICSINLWVFSMSLDLCLKSIRFQLWTPSMELPTNYTCKICQCTAILLEFIREIF